MLASKMWQAKAASYRSHMVCHLKHYVLPALGADTPIDRITADDLRRFKHELADGDLTLRTCNRILVTIRQVLKYADDSAGYCSTPSLPRNFRESAQELADAWHRLQPAEVAHLLAHVGDDTRPFFTYVANTGLRVGTALETLEDWVDLDQRIVRYPAGVMKGRRPHVVELNDDALAALRVALERSPGEPWPWTYWFARTRWLEARAAAGLPDVRIHDLRHSWVSNQLDAGTPIHVVRDMAAHASLSTTQLYAHSSDEARRKAAGAVRVPVDLTLGAAVQTSAQAPAAAPADTRTDTRKRAKKEPLSRKVAETGAQVVPRGGIEPPTRGFSEEARLYDLIAKRRISSG
ncbi:MAG: site-specific integrase [Elusimicrobiota bacterium]|jgi:integrase